MIKEKNFVGDNSKLIEELKKQLAEKDAKIATLEAQLKGVNKEKEPELVSPLYHRKIVQDFTNTFKIALMPTAHLTKAQLDAYCKKYCEEHKDWNLDYSNLRLYLIDVFPDCMGSEILEEFEFIK